MSTLIQRIASFANLYEAFSVCCCGKRDGPSYQVYIGKTAQSLFEISQEILQTKNYKWGAYRKFYVCDPKRRRIASAPFKDRVVHTAICRVLEPILEKYMSPSSYACRIGKGTTNAVLDLKEFLMTLKSPYYAIKLDVTKYFENINHAVLMRLIGNVLAIEVSQKDNDLEKLLLGLLQNDFDYKKYGKGIPLGNLTSQLFANFYLKDVDFLAKNLLSSENEFYIRYMDDMLIVASTKERACIVARSLEERMINDLFLAVSFKKKVHLKNCPIPFLGFLLSPKGIMRPLVKNHRKFVRKYKACKDPLERAYKIRAFHSWAQVELTRKKT